MLVHNPRTSRHTPNPALALARVKVLNAGRESLCKSSKITTRHTKPDEHENRDLLYKRISKILTQAIGFLYDRNLQKAEKK